MGIAERMEVGWDRRKEEQVPFPIRLKESVSGTLGVPYKPTFTQQNGQLSVIENVDFNVHGDERVWDHALSTAYMFQDIASAHSTVAPVELVAVYSLNHAANFDAQGVGMAALKSVEKIRLINWGVDRERERFVRDRVRIAQGLEH